MPLKDYRFIDRDFSGMLVNVNAISTGKDVYYEAQHILGMYPIFEPLSKYNPKKSDAENTAAIKQGNLAKFRSEVVSNNKVLRYIALFYDIESPLNQKISDYYERKIVAAEMARFKINDGDEFDAVYQDVMNGKNPTVNHMVIYYLRLMNNHVYTTLRTTLDNFYNEILPNNDMGKIQTTSNFITKLTKDFLMDEKLKEEAFMKPTLFAVVNKELAEIENLRPERVLTKIMEW